MVNKKDPRHFHFRGDLKDVLEWIAILRELESVRFCAIVPYINCALNARAKQPANSTRITVVDDVKNNNETTSPTTTTNTNNNSNTLPNNTTLKTESSTTKFFQKLTGSSQN